MNLEQRRALIFKTRRFAAAFVPQNRCLRCIGEAGRSDLCAVPRAVPIIEAMVAIVLADALLEKLGGDSLGEMKPRFEALRRCHLEDIELDNKPWRFS